MKISFDAKYEMSSDEVYELVMDYAKDKLDEYGYAFSGCDQYAVDFPSVAWYGVKCADIDQQPDKE